MAATYQVPCSVVEPDLQVLTLVRAAVLMRPGEFFPYTQRLLGP